MKNSDKVREFMIACGQEVLSTPTLLDDDTRFLRETLITEEYWEFFEASGQGNLVAIADSLTDLLYVIYGAAHAYGIDIDACFAEVHRSNMSKVGPDGKVVRREDGKILKPDTYTPPDLESILKA